MKNKNPRRVSKKATKKDQIRSINTVELKKIVANLSNRNKLINCPGPFVTVGLGIIGVQLGPVFGPLIAKIYARIEALKSAIGVCNKTDCPFVHFLGHVSVTPFIVANVYVCIVEEKWTCSMAEFIPKTYFID